MHSSSIISRTDRSLLPGSSSILFLLLAALFILTSCARQDTADFYGHYDDDDISPVSSMPFDPELLLEEAEPEKCLNEELEALRNAGAWEGPGTAGLSKAAQKDSGNDFPIVVNKQVEAYIDLFQNRQKKTFGRWLARSGKYIEMFREELREAGLPEDLAYLAMIESGFNQRAYSKAKAVGLWQFIKSTGLMYNLAIDSYVDERRHAEKSTAAAIAFLSDLYAEFGDWHLAVAGYNAGAGKIKKGLKRYKCDDFWSLARHNYLPLETKRYVPKLIAAIIIARDPEKYGFTDIDYAPPLSYETVRVGPGLSLDAVALLCGTDAKTIKELNRELKTGRTPYNRKDYDVQIPVGTRELAEANLPRLHRVASTGYKTHVIKRGDTISGICRLYNINKTTLLKINNLKSTMLIAGRHLRIPHGSVQYRLLQEGELASLASGGDLHLHTVRRGETLSKISSRYRVPTDLIVLWNGLESVHRIRAGQQLSLYLPEKNGAPHSTGTTTEEPPAAHTDSGATIVLAAQSKFPVDSRANKTVQHSWYQVRNGDSLWAIARKFNLSTQQLKSWNHLKSNMIQPGTRLKIKKV